MATLTKLPSGKYRAQVRRQGVYRAQSFARKIDAQGWAVEIERAIESGSSRGLMRPAAGMTLQDVIAAFTEQVTFHDLRHAAITELFRKGLGIPEVALVSGHRSWRELKRYTQLTATDVLGKFKALELAGG